MKQIIQILICLLPLFMLSQGGEYIEIIRPDINIRMLPSTSSPIIGHAFNGEIYFVDGENDKWYQVRFPSGESRWIYKKLAKKTSNNSNLELDLDYKFLQQELKIASDNANKDANEENIGDLNKIQVNNILFDRYVLLVLQKYNISTVFYDSIINYIEPSFEDVRQKVAEYLVSVSHIDYDLFKIDSYNFYIETRRCFKLGSALDAMVFMYYEGDEFIQKLCFEDGYGNGFDNCYNIKHIYQSVLDEPNLVVLTQDGKMKRTNLVLKETLLEILE